MKGLPEAEDNRETPQDGPNFAFDLSVLFGTIHMFT
jgi:hypothetical protein